MLDNTDLKILRLLQSDGRITNQDLAQNCQMSASACFDRVRRLRDQGYILGFAALLDPVKLDRSALIFVEVGLDRSGDQQLAEFARAIQALPEIMDCHLIGGDFDYLLKIRLQSLDKYRAYLGSVLAALPAVCRLRARPVLEQVKSSCALAI
jgi:Lrp/AsnC family leucine-responsive transcriptional regulator